MGERRALLAATATAAADRDNGASLRAREVADLLRRSGYVVELSTPRDLPPTSRHYDLAVAVSYACAGALRRLRRSSERTWLDAVDSWLAVDSSGLRSGRPAYALRAVRDAARLATAGSADLVTYISLADLRADHGTVRGAARLVLPGLTPAPAALASVADGRRLVLAGDWGYPPNADGLRWFWQNVLPAVEGRLVRDRIAVDVYGTHVPDVRSSVLRQRGYAEDAGDLYRAGDVHVAPVRFGGGVKRKVLQPLLSGLPVVTTPAGARGLRAHPLLDVHRSPQAVATAILRRLDDDNDAPRPARSEELHDADDRVAVTDWLLT